MVFRLTLLNVLNSDFAEMPFAFESEKENRRVFERIYVDKRFRGFHGQDIFLVRDVSAGGMLVEAPERSVDLLEIHKVYRCQLRYLEHKFQVHLGVRWKQDNLMGFQFVHPEPLFKEFIEKLLQAAQIGQSLKRMPHKAVTWYYGLNDTSLFLWKTVDVVAQWLLVAHMDFLQYKNGKIKLGRLSKSLNLTDPLVEIENLSENSFHENNVIKQRLIDILMSSIVDEKNSLLDTLV